MKLLTKQIISSRSHEEISRIIQSTAYRFHTPIISENSFSIVCMRRYVGSLREYSRIVGTFEREDPSTKITISLRAGFSFYAGMVMVLVGLWFTVIPLLSQTPGWQVGIFWVVFGAFSSGQYYWAGQSHIDRLAEQLK